MFCYNRESNLFVCHYTYNFTNFLHVKGDQITKKKISPSIALWSSLTVEKKYCMIIL